MKKTLLATAFFAALGLGALIAQTITAPGVIHVNPADLFLDVVNGQPTAQGVYARADQISSQWAYKDLGTITTDPAYTVTGAIVNIFGHSTGTVTAVTITTPVNPGDGRRICYYNDHTTTTLTFTASTGQSIDSNVVAAGVANIPACIVYNATSTVWKNSN
jgi:hypothetical protein